VKIKDNFEVWCHIYRPVSKWVTQQSYSASRGKAYMASCVQSCRNASLCVSVVCLSVTHTFSHAIAAERHPVACRSCRYDSTLLLTIYMCHSASSFVSVLGAYLFISHLSRHVGRSSRLLHVTFSISKNTVAVDTLLLKFKVTWSEASCIAVSCCDVHGSQTDLR
jgi:hypothetical protein